MANIIPTGSTQASGGTRKGGKAVFSGRMIGGTPSQAEPLNVAFGQGSPNGTRITSVTTDLGLSGEIVANGAQTTRIAGSSSQVTTSGGFFNDTYQVQGTITCNLGGGLAITEASLHDTSAYPGADLIANANLGVLTGTGTGTFTVNSGSSFPTTSTDYQVEQEVFTATRSGTTVTITARGVNGSTAVAHTAAGNTNITEVSQSGTGNGGTMAAKGDFAVVNLAQNDTLQLTAKVQFT